MAHCPLHGPLAPGRSSASSTSIPLYGLQSLPHGPLVCTVLCPLYIALFPLTSSDPSTAFCHSVALDSFTALCTLYGSPFPLQPFVPSMGLCLLYGPLSPPLLSVPSSALCPLYGPLSPLRPSTPLWISPTSFDLHPLYGPLSILRPSLPSASHVYFLLFCETGKMTCLVSQRSETCLVQCFAKHVFVKKPFQ
jgi:hypothetical protein